MPGEMDAESAVSVSAASRRLEHRGGRRRLIPPGDSGERRAESAAKAEIADDLDKRPLQPGPRFRKMVERYDRLTPAFIRRPVTRFQQLFVAAQRSIGRFHELKAFSPFPAFVRRPLEPRSYNTLSEKNLPIPGVSLRFAAFRSGKQGQDIADTARVFHLFINIEVGNKTRAADQRTVGNLLNGIGSRRTVSRCRRPCLFEGKKTSLLLRPELEGENADDEAHTRGKSHEDEQEQHKLDKSLTSLICPAPGGCLHEVLQNRHLVGV